MTREEAIDRINELLRGTNPETFDSPDEVQLRHPDAEPEDVLLWAEARQYAAEA